MRKIKSLSLNVEEIYAYSLLIRNVYTFGNAIFERFEFFAHYSKYDIGV